MKFVRNWGRLGMKYNLGNICKYRKEKIDIASLKCSNYISTENMLPNKGGIVEASSLPTTSQVQAYKYGDVLVSNIRPYFKKIWKAEFNGGCSNDVLVFESNSDIDEDFLYYILSDDAFFAYAMTTSKGTKMPRGDKTAIMQYVVPKTELLQQRKIASVLKSFDKKIKINNKINDNLQQQVQLLYEDFITTIGETPMAISEVIDVRDGTHDSPKPVDSGYPLITSKHLLPFGVDVISPNKISEFDYNKVNERSKVDTNDILLSMIGTVGLVSLIIEDETNFAIKNVGLFKTSKCPHYTYYLLCYLKSKETARHIEKCLAGSTQKYISLTELRKMPISIPNALDMNKFNDLVTPLFSLIIENVKANKALTAIRDSLLPKLMLGELDVTNIDF